MSSDLKKTILAIEDLEHRDIEVPQWATKEYPKGFPITLRGLTGAERGTFESSMSSFNMGVRGEMEIEITPENYTLHLVGRCMVDPETKERIFKDGEIVSLLGKKSAASIGFIFKHAAELSGMNEEALEKIAGE